MDELPIPAQDLRVSDAERDHVAELLTQHLGAGRLTPEEYAERADAAARAVVRGELNRLVVDLPGAHLPESLTKDVLELVNTAGDLRRDGEWIVPSRVVLRSRFGNAHLDLRRARTTTPVVLVEIDIGVGNVDIRLPDGATADLDDVTARWGSVYDRTTKRFERGGSHVVVRGRTGFGNISVR